MHLTARVAADAHSLRQPEVRALFRTLLEGARERGVRTVSFALLPDHVHWVVLARSRAALGDATRYVFSQLARQLNRRWRRKGALFVERYWSVCCRSVKQAFVVLNYVLSNALKAGCWSPVGVFDRFSGFDVQLLPENRFLRSVLGPTPAVWGPLLGEMALGRLAFVPVSERVQPRLPGM